MNVLVACEFSGIVREAFLKRGHYAYSVDLLNSEIPSKRHLKGDITKFPWWNIIDLMIAFPPCTHLCSSGAKWWNKRQQEQKNAIDFFSFLIHAPVRRICVENPVGIISTVLRKPDQIIQPWMFGHPETKATCLWLKNLPKLKPTKIVDGREHRAHKMPESKNRWKERSRTYTGIAEAMAKQWNF